MEKTIFLYTGIDFFAFLWQRLKRRPISLRIALSWAVSGTPGPVGGNAILTDVTGQIYRWRCISTLLNWIIRVIRYFFSIRLHWIQPNPISFQPTLVNGWFWSGSGVRIGATNVTANGQWSSTGGDGKAQPDNREFRVTVSSRSLLRILPFNYSTTVYIGTSFSWHSMHVDIQLYKIVHISTILHCTELENTF